MADKRFQLTFDVNANINPIKGAIGELKGSLNNLKIPDTFKKSIESTITLLEKEITNFESIASKGFSNMGDFNKANRSFEKISDLFSKLGIQVKNLKGVDPNKFLPAETLKKTQSLQQAWLKLKQVVDKGVSTEGIEKTTQALEKQRQKLEELQATEKKYRDQQQSEINRRNELQAKLGDKDIKGSLLYEQKNLTKRVRDAELSGNTKNNATYTNNKKALEDLNKTISSYRAEITAAEQKIADFDTKIIGATADVEKQSTKVDNLTKDLEELENASQKAPEGIKQFIEDLKSLDGIDTKAIDDAGEDLEKLQQILTNYQAGKAKEIADGISKVGENAEKLDQPVSEAAEEIHKFGDECSYADEKTRELENVANQVKQFFSIGNTVQLFKRAIRSAFDTIKELDAVMTQTAVVTDFTVGDMWAQLPEYTKRANELGVSVKGAYEAATLYYQQGLSTNEVIGVSNETLKMAKIAAIDYATATDYMTSALRGFNMEVNEQSAKKVNDIYSQLAAKTAADTEEISIAMSKTAPLAHNAGMEIETTAAFLAQAIETTREAPETIGTAMKTVIARFQELKKDPALIEPVEGEIVDANKIEGALRTIGVALRDTNGQFRDLDDVFLEISQKWNSLDTNTQRYIATIAAGSRQQSRFIAMMANYDRTMELVEMANTSAGASQQQFEKTLDSMQSKLDRLKNAWNEFTMGLANNSVIKAVVDLLTDLLNAINKISSGVSGNNSILKSLVDIGILMGGLKMGRAAFSGFFNWLQGKSKAEGQTLGGNLFKGITNIFSKNKEGKKGLLGKLLGTDVIGSTSNWLDKINRKLSAKIETNEAEELWATFYKGRGDSLFTNKWSNILNFPSFSDIKDKITDAFTEIRKIGKKAGENISKAFSLIPGPLKIAIPLAIALGAAIYKIAKDNSIEERIKKAEESTKRAQEAANQAKEAYDNLLEGKSTYDELQNKLNNLTYGTTAWKEALIEANGQVLELLQTFPQLAQYMSPGVNGRLEISAEGWDTVIEQQQEAVRRTTNDLLGAQIYRANLENENIYKQLQKASGIQRKGLLDELIKQYENNAAFFAKDENGNYNQDLRALAFKYNINADKIYEAQDALREYEAAIQQNGATISSYVDGLVANNIKIEGLSQEETDILSNAYNEKINENYNRKIEQEAKDLTAYSHGAVGHLADTLNKYGLEVTANTTKNLQTLYKYLANITGEEIDNEILKSEKAMAEAIARMEFGDEIEASINNVAQKLKADTTGGIQKILNILGGEIGDFTTQDLGTFKQVFDENSTIEKAAKSLNMSKKNLEDIIIDMGYSVKDASGELVADFESFRQAFLDGVIDLEEGIIEARNNITSNLTKIGFSEGQITAKTGSFTDKQAIAFSGFTNKISSIDIDTQYSILDKITTLLSRSGKIISDETLDLINSIDFSNPIDSILALQEAAKSTNTMLSETAKQMLSLDEFSADKAFKDFMISDEYSQMEESLKDFINTNGKISPKNIKDLAKENSKLNKLLQIETVNANGLAKALTAVGNNDIGFEQITASMLKALSSTIDLDNELEELNDKFSNLDKGFDTNINVENYQKTLEELQTYVDNGELGNEQFKNLYEFIFGEGSWKEAVENDFNGLQNAIDTKKQLFENDGLAFWDSFIQKMNSGEISIEGLKFDAEGNIEELELTAEELKEALIEKMKLTPDEATAMLGVLKNYNPAAGLKLDENNAQKEYEVWLTELEGNHKSFVNKTTIVTQQQLELWSKLTGKNITEIQKEIANLNGSIKVVDWFSNEGVELYGQQLEQQMHDAFSTKEKEWNFEEDIGVQTTTDLSTGQVVKYVDYEVAIKYAQDNKLSMEQLNSLLEENGVQVYNKEIGFKANTKDMEAALDTVTENKSAELQQKAQEAVDGVDTEAFTGKVQEAVATGAGSGLQEAMDNFSPNTVKIPIDFDITGNSSGTVTYSITAAKGTTLNNPKVGKIANTGAETRNRNNKVTFATKASGTDYGGLKHSEIALTGEEGYELAYNKNGAFLLGANGPEVAKLDKGTVIYPHDLSKKILGGYSKSIFPNYKTGTIPNYVDAPYRWTKSPLTSVIITSTDYSEAASNFESLTSSMEEAAETAEDITEETEKWENEVDWLYNMTQQINHELRIRNKLEREYNRALKTHAASGEELRRLTNQEIVSLKKRQDMQKEMIELRKKELHTYMMLNKEMMKYAIIDNWDDMTIHIAWDSINNITDKDEYERAIAFKDKLEDFQKQVYDLEDDVEDIEDEILELQERGKDEYRDLEDRVLAALISEQQEMIDKEEEAIKAIGNAEKDLVDAIQKNIDKMRQDRDNEEKESSLAEKERRLAYLRQDTTGSNALEIKQLEKELEKEKQDYTDTLIDQAIKDMKEQADEASKQREKQIELLQQQLEWQEKTGYWADEATRIVQEGLGPNGIMDRDSRLYKLLYEQEGVITNSNASRDKWDEDLADSISKAFVWLNNVLNKQNNGADVVESMKQNSQNWLTASSGEQSNLHAENERLAREYEAATGEKLTYNNGAWYKENGQRLYSLDEDTIGRTIVEKMKANSTAWTNADDNTRQKLEAENEELARRLKSVTGKDITKKNGVWYIGGQELYKKYKHGGLADFTGPAWLDGSKSKPEMVLNAKDTKNFIQLKDVLSSLRSGIVGRNAQGGDWYFDIDINVDEIANDYDVDKVAARIKQSIYEETAYRNVNAINFLK